MESHITSEGERMDIPRKQSRNKNDVVSEAPDIKRFIDMKSGKFRVYPDGMEIKMEMAGSMEFKEMPMTVDDLYIVNYCHRNCTPLQNIMRLPKEEAFALAQKMAAQNKETTAFYRFADFENYYPERMKTDERLLKRFIELGGKPLQEHPLSFVLQGSEFLNDWFDRGTITRIPLNLVPQDYISFTYGDSMTALKRHGGFTMLTKGMLSKAISDYGGTLADFLFNTEKQYHYIEVQVWDDACLRI